MRSLKGRLEGHFKEATFEEATLMNKLEGEVIQTGVCVVPAVFVDPSGYSLVSQNRSPSHHR
jgi:hypothetical protein